MMMTGVRCPGTREPDVAINDRPRRIAAVDRNGNARAARHPLDHQTIGSVTWQKNRQMQFPESGWTISPSSARPSSVYISAAKMKFGKVNTGIFRVPCAARKPSFYVRKFGQNQPEYAGRPRAMAPSLPGPCGLDGGLRWDRGGHPSAPANRDAAPEITRNSPI